MDIENRGTILIVDDNIMNLQVLIDHLREGGYKILVARSGETAIRQMEFAIPDLILLDVMMPGMDGFETCRRLKEDEATKDIPVIFVTALSETFDKVRGFRAGAVDYVTKPFEHEEVLARVRAHLTIQKQKKALAELNATKDKFFSIIAHDMKNVFNVLLGFSKVLSDSVSVFTQEEVETFAKSMNTSAEAAFRLLENLLSWARFQRGMMDFNPGPLDIGELLSGNITLLKESAKKKGIALSSSMEMAGTAYGDREMVNTVLRNLISNAIKFTHERGEVGVSAVVRDGFVEISVSDTGTGIHEDDLPKLFRIDQKVKENGTAGEEGTGLGLILCKDFVEKNSGKIWAESELGKGAVFRFTLPRSD